MRQISASAYALIEYLTTFTRQYLKQAGSAFRLPELITLSVYHTLLLHLKLLDYII